MGSAKLGVPGQQFSKITESVMDKEAADRMKRAALIKQMYKSRAPTLADEVASARIGQAISEAPIASADPIQRARMLQGLGKTGQEAALGSAQMQAEKENRLQEGLIKDINRQAAIDAAQGKSTASKIGAAASGIGSAISFFSDENVKKDILDIEGFTKNFLATLHPYSFRYKEDVGMGGKVIGVMAQDLEKTNVGSSLVFEHEGKKTVDVPRTVSLLLAVIADLDKRLKKVEG